jgi:TRAP-type C4-dicarboxylate transport system permease small subunit
MSSFYAAIPLCGVLVSLFTIEQIVNGWRNGFVTISDEGERRQSL